MASGSAARWLLDGLGSQKRTQITAFFPSYLARTKPAMQGTVEATVESIRTLPMPLTQSGRVIHRDCVSYKLAISSIMSTTSHFRVRAMA